MQSATPATRPVLKELTCPNCGSPLSQYTPDAQTLVCGKCGGYVAVGMGDPTLLSKGARFPSPPVPLKVGQRITLENTGFFVLGRVMYKGWDDEDSWTWNEWLLGAADGRMLWLAYDKEDGFVLFNKLRFRQSEEFRPEVSMSIPLGDGKKASVKERYPAAIVGAEGELTWQAKRDDRLQMIEATSAGKHYSMQVSEQELELYEGHTLPTVQVAAALDDKAWLQSIQRQEQARKTRRYIGVACLVFAGIALVAGVAVGSTGELIADHSFALSPTQPEVVFPVEFDQAGRPAIVKAWLQTELPPNTYVDADVSVISPNEVETLVMSQEFYHETGVDDGGPWTEKSMEVSDTFVPYLSGAHQVEVALTAGSITGGAAPVLGNLDVRVEVYKNHIVPGWFLGYGITLGVVGLVLLAHGGGLSVKAMLIIAAPIVILLILLALGVEFGDIIEFILDALSEV